MKNYYYIHAGFFLALNVNYSDRLTKEALFGKLRSVSDIIKDRRVIFAADCCCVKNEIFTEGLLWKRTNGRANRGGKCKDIH